MDSLVKIDKPEERVLRITMDDGKSNVQSPQMLNELQDALDTAQKEKVVVILTGREGVFSAGFDLKVLKRGNLDTIKMLRGGFELAERLLSFPTPVIVACSGHALAMGAFLLLAVDHRIGAAGEFKIATNEVAIGLTMPKAGVEICRQRLAPAHLSRAAILAEEYHPETALQAGFLDRVVAADELQQVAQEAALAFTQLDMRAHYRTKMRIRGEALTEIRKAIRNDMGDFLMEGGRRTAGKLMDDVKRLGKLWGA